jgi:hypothetical protein
MPGSLQGTHVSMLMYDNPPWDRFGAGSDGLTFPKIG